MKKFVLAAALLAPLAAGPAFAQEVLNPYVQVQAPAPSEAPREFTQRNALLGAAATRADRSERVQIDRQAVPSSVISLPY